VHLSEDINLVSQTAKQIFIEDTFCGSSSESSPAASLLSLSDILESTTEAGKGLGRSGSPFPKLG
jgi:hypothetical protein